jgi:hypothetical protein
MSHGRQWEAPAIERGFPIPPERRADLRRRKRPSPWLGFLDRLLGTVKNAARILGVTIVWTDAEVRNPDTGLRKARVWRST